MPRPLERFADAAVSPFDEMTARHRKEALALQQKMLERLRRLDADDLKPAEVVRWFDVAVRVEKETMDALRGDEEGAKIREFIQCLLADPEACDLANQLVQRLASRVAVSGGAGVVGDAKDVAVGKAPRATGPLAG